MKAVAFLPPPWKQPEATPTHTERLLCSTTCNLGFLDLTYEGNIGKPCQFAKAQISIFPATPRYATVSNPFKPLNLTKSSSLEPPQQPSPKCPCGYLIPKVRGPPLSASRVRKLPGFRLRPRLYNVGGVLGCSCSWSVVALKRVEVEWNALVLTLGVYRNWSRILLWR